EDLHADCGCYVSVEDERGAAPPLLDARAASVVPRGGEERRVRRSDRACVLERVERAAVKLELLDLGAVVADCYPQRLGVDWRPLEHRPYPDVRRLQRPVAVS